MSVSDPSDPDVVDPLTDDPLAFLYEPGDENEDEDSTADNPSYGSLMGLAVRRDGAGVKPAKAMAIVLDELEAQRAAEVMEINAGQLMTNPDRSSRQVGFVSLGLDTLDEEGDEDDLAESLTWEAEAEDDGGDWQPENPLAGTGIAEDDEDDDADWQPVDPLAGTGIVQDDGDWQPENPLAGTEFEGQDDWEPAEQSHVEPAPAEAPAPSAVLPEAADDDWNMPLPSAERPPEAPAAEEEQAWTAGTPSADDPVAPFEEVEWEAPLAAAPEPESPPAEAEAPIEAEAQIEAEPPILEASEPAVDDILPEAAEAAPAEWQPVAEAEPASDDPSDHPTIEWQALLVKKTGKKALALPPVDWNEFTFEESATGEASVEPAEPVPTGWADEAAAELPGLSAEPDWQAYAEEEEAEAAEALGHEWPTAAPEAADEAAGPYDTEWSAFTASPPAEPAAPESEFTYEPEFFAGEETESGPQFAMEPQVEPESAPEAGFPPELEQIEIVCFPAPPPIEVPHHSLRAKVMKAQQPRTPPPSRLKPVLKWLAAQFRQIVLPQLKRLWAWAGAKWSEIASRPPRD